MLRPHCDPSPSNAWKAAGYPLTTDTPSVARTSFQARPRPEEVATYEDILARLGDGQTQIVDVRRNGVIEEVVITTGVSDTESVEVLTGLSEGDTVVVPALRAAEEEAEAQPTIPGGIR